MYDEAMDLREIGTLKISRASHGEQFSRELVCIWRHVRTPSAAT